ncbi:uncharacterized protein [Euwallacea fornicatus]|uniref:uncharacterized protein n=1 Tax=Euwallacea fornicatus TaxID=995702 RepID=UPI00338D6B53
MKHLNLFLRHQIINSNFMNEAEETLYKEECSGRFVVPQLQAVVLTDSASENRSEDLKVHLANVQLEESENFEQHKELIESYNLLETILEYLLNHIERTVLEIQSATRMCSLLNVYLVRKRCIDDTVTSTLKKLTETYASTTLNGLKGKLLTILNDNNGEIKKLQDEFFEKQRNYSLALKNFKIILEILNVNDGSLRKLQQQFDEVLMDYQQCRCIVNHALPFAIAQRTEVLADCLISLGAEFDIFADRHRALGSLFSYVGKKLSENEYIGAKKQVLSLGSNDDD